MFTLKCFKQDGTIDVFEVSEYTVHPPKEYSEGQGISTAVTGYDPGIKEQRSLVLLEDSEPDYSEIFVENSYGKTVDTIRPVSTIQ